MQTVKACATLALRMSPKRVLASPACARRQSMLSCRMRGSVRCLQTLCRQPTRSTSQAMVRPYNFSRGASSSSTKPQPMSRFGRERVALGRIVASILDDIPQPHFLDNGTLLGFWRDGALIENDDDFDLGVLVDASDYSIEWLSELLALLEHRLSSSPYQCRMVHTYAQKIEVYDPTYGFFDLEDERYGGANYHHVSVDIQPHVRSGTEVTIMHNDFAARDIRLPIAVYEPLGKVSYADVDWPIPADPKRFLAFLYGYLGHGAVFDPIAVLYRKEIDVSSKVRLYTDMCADLFHLGHVNYLKQCKNIFPNVHLMVGLHDDQTIGGYKRTPICTLEERAAVVGACVYVDQVILHAPLRITQLYMKEHSIDMVVHGDKVPPDQRAHMYAVPIEMGRYTEVFRTPGISTTDIIDRIVKRMEALPRSAATDD